MNKQECLQSVCKVSATYCTIVSLIFCLVNPLKPFVSLPKTNKGEQLPPLADETSVARCLTTALA